MKEKDREFFIVDKRILPNSIQNVIKINEIVQKEGISKYEAIKKVGISRSTYYKYKDYIKPFFESGKDTVFNINMAIHDEPGMISKIFNIIAEFNVNVLTITQNIPIDGIARITLALRTNTDAMRNLENMLEKITEQPGVAEIRIIGNN
ncbi:MAG: ACT domain-containing protein [Fusobacteria bacterium]|nr:MAG: ACT domain-containing protein [Fusobacteriota bacterium]